MEKDVFRKMAVDNFKYKSHFGFAFWTLSRVIGLTIFSIYLSTSEKTGVWLLGQLFFAFSILQWFVLVHDFGHYYFFKSRIANWIWGHIASVFCLVPFVPWSAIHEKHHVWTGWQNKDPTMESTLSQFATPSRRFLVRWAWWLCIPLISLSFSLKNFWNLWRLRKLFPHQRNLFFGFLFSLALMTICFCIIFPRIPNFFKLWALGYYLFLVMADPLLLSQHSHVPQKIALDENVRPVPVYEQENYSRSLVFPNWVSKFVLLNFDAHGTHHVWPTIPCYFVDRVRVKCENDMPWWVWLKRVKMLPADRIIFSSRETTGWDI